MADCITFGNFSYNIGKKTSEKFKKKAKGFENIMRKLIFRYKKYILLGVLLFSGYFFSRLINLTNLPIFTDEAIYIRWAQIANKDANWRFISLTDGKQPLFVWGVMVLLRFVSDPLAAGRIVSVIAGFFSMIGIGLLGRELFKNERIGIFSSVLYILYPFALLYDRMALMDSMTAMFYIWSLYFAVLLVRTLRLDVALILGMILGGGLLTKSIGLISIYLLPSTLILFDFNKKNRKKRFFKWLGLSLIAVVLSQIYYNVLRLSPWFNMIRQKDNTFIFSMQEWLKQPYRFFHGNIWGQSKWVLSYSTPALAILYIFAFPALLSLAIFSYWRPDSNNLLLIFWFIFPLYFLWRARNQREKLLLYLWFVAPFTGLAVFGKVLYPRFVLFMTMPLIVLAAWTLDFLWQKVNYKKLLVACYLLLVTYPIYFSAKILFSIVTAPITRIDRDQYINDWPSGWGIRETVDILEKKAKKEKITVYTEGTFGLLPYGIEIYLVDNPNIEIIGLWPVPKRYTKEMKKKLKTKPVYYISNQFQEIPESWNSELVGEWIKGETKDRSLRLYRLKPLREGAKNE